MDAFFKIFCLIGTNQLVYLVTGLTDIYMMGTFALTS